jgi:hypothetical protein
MVEENGRYLGLAVMTYESVFDRRERAPAAAPESERRLQIPLTVVAIESEAAGSGTRAASA